MFPRTGGGAVRRSATGAGAGAEVTPEGGACRALGAGPGAFARATRVGFFGAMAEVGYVIRPVRSSPRTGISSGVRLFIELPSVFPEHLQPLRVARLCFESG